MMELTGLAAIAMIVLMVVMCGGMIFGMGWAALRGRRNRESE